MTNRSNHLRRMATMLALLGAGIAGTATVASAAGTSHTSARAAHASNVAPNPATLPNGPGETLLTGTTYTSAIAAAKAAEPTATVIRAETDAQGATYEVHMQNADGTYVTVKLDASFTVTAIETGFGQPPNGQAPRGPGNGQSPTAGSAPTNAPTPF
jgi:uncharacterized membrane protein YkoI